MATRVQRIIEEMQAARLVAIRQSGVIATCVEGRIWVTRDDDTRDTVLGVGESFTTSSRCRVILEALIPSRVFLDYPVTGTRVGLLDSIKAVRLAVKSRCGPRLEDPGRSDRHSAAA